MVDPKKNRKKLFISPNDVPNDQMIAEERLIRDRLRKHFRGHIGRDEATDPVSIWARVMDMDPYDTDIFHRAYHWNRIKKVMSELKRSGEVFITHRGGKYFVVKTDDEAKTYDIAMKKTSKNCEESAKKCYEWVKEKKWKNF